MSSSATTTIAWTKILEDFKKKHKEFKAECKKLQYGSAGAWNANQRAYEKWIKDNVTSTGASYEFDEISGEPICLFKVLAGKKKTLA